MKIIISFLMLLSFGHAKFEKVVNYNSFKEASKGELKLHFMLENTKVGLFTSTVDGYVKKFKYKGELNKENLIIRNMEISFNVEDMDTDSDGRNEKMKEYCLEMKKYPQVVLKVSGPLFLKDRRDAVLKGEVSLRGKAKPFNLKVKSTDKEDSYIVTGTSRWSFKDMEIPDPSIAVAKLSDKIDIKFKVKVQL